MMAAGEKKSFDLKLLLSRQRGVHICRFMSRCIIWLLIFSYITQIYYRPQTKCAKVMFLQVSVCPHWGGVHGFIQGGVRGFIWGQVWFYLVGGHAWFYLGGVCGFIWGGMHGFIWGGMHGFIRGGVCGFIQGGHAWFFWGGHAWFFQLFQIK